MSDRRTFDRRGDRPFLVWEPFDGPVTTWTYARFGAEARALAAGADSLQEISTPASRDRPWPVPSSDGRLAFP